MIRLRQILAFFAVSAASVAVVFVVTVVTAGCILAGSVGAQAGCVPDTGQTTSYTNTFGEDSDHTINPQSYTDLGDTVKDNVTGLIWQKATAGPMTWDKAKDYCASIGCRLPTVKELLFIVNSGTHDPAINTTYFPNTLSSYYWSSTTSARYSGYAWCVYFSDGGVSYGYKSVDSYVRAVRSGQ
jgi:hypothetical protein